MTEAEQMQQLGFIPVGNENNSNNKFKETLLYFIKCDKDVQETIKKFVL